MSACSVACRETPCLPTMSSKNPERPMTFDSKRFAAAEFESRQLEPRQLEPTHIGQVFRYLSDEHQETKRRDDAEATWQAVEYRLRFGKNLRPGFWARLNAPGAGPLSAPKMAFLAAAAAVCLA